MSYQKTTWANGMVISADRMNNIENGLAAVAAQGQDTGLIVIFNLDDIIAQAQSENGFSLSTFTDVIEQGKTICILKRVGENDYSSLQDFVYFLSSSWSYDSTISFVFVNSKIFLDSLDKNLTYTRLSFDFNEDLLTQINLSQYFYNLSTATGEETLDTIWPVSTDPIESGNTM